MEILPVSSSNSTAVVPVMRTSKYGESNTSMLDDPTLQARNPIKEILLKLNLPDHSDKDYINDTIGYDQINRDIIFDDPNVNVNSGSVEHDYNAYASYESEQLA
ncbi:hypothetical protein Tco_0952478 [Tanacetum coccineum]|uniref:Uncharacterized protein n=1 Tax=Tanacetum coccineum TaxID=301880 RepID=A0ABQ5DXP5_9ASTR